MRPASGPRPSTPRRRDAARGASRAEVPRARRPARRPGRRRTPRGARPRERRQRARRRRSPPGIPRHETARRRRPPLGAYVERQPVAADAVVGFASVRRRARGVPGRRGCVEMVEERRGVRAAGGTGDGHAASVRRGSGRARGRPAVDGAGPTAAAVRSPPWHASSPNPASLSGKAWKIDPGLTLGREAHNTIAMPDNKKSSRDHAKVWREAPGQLRDRRPRQHERHAGQRREDQRASRWPTATRSGSASGSSASCSTTTRSPRRRSRRAEPHGGPARRASRAAPRRRGGGRLPTRGRRSRSSRASSSTRRRTRRAASRRGTSPRRPAA